MAMTCKPLDISVLLIVYKRPDATRQVFNALRDARPARLYVAADGPSEDKAGEREKCQAVRQIIEGIDWECKVKTLYHEGNLGCKRAVSSALNWFFENEEEGIILEDDCLPHPTFFRYCQELLSRYRDDARVMQISGTNFFSGQQKCVHSYYFSKFGSIWGWASWRRAWQHNDVDMTLWPEIRRNNVYPDFCDSKREGSFRLSVYDKVYSGDIDTWDYQWGFSKMLNSGLNIMPNVNLISNIGFGSDGTHLTSASLPAANMKTFAMEFPLRHPAYVCRNKIADKKQFREFIYTPSWANKLSSVLHRLLPDPVHSRIKAVARKIIRYF